MRYQHLPAILASGLVVSACTGGYLVRYAENFQQAPSFDEDFQKQYGMYKTKDGTWEIGKEAIKTENIKVFAHALKNKSDDLCNKYKNDLAITQNGMNFLLTTISQSLSVIGAAVAGPFGQATNVVSSITSGVNENSQSIIYQNIKSIVSNSIDTKRLEDWKKISYNLDNNKYSDYAEVFGELQNYHSDCSLTKGLEQATEIISAAKASAAPAVDQNTENFNSNGSQGVGHAAASKTSNHQNQDP